MGLLVVVQQRSPPSWALRLKTRAEEIVFAIRARSSMKPLLSMTADPHLRVGELLTEKKVEVFAQFLA